MIQLFGFQLSNYYNCVKMYLLEKDIPFSEHNDEVVLVDDVANAGAALVQSLRLPNLPTYIARIAERPSYVAATATIRSKLSELGLS